MKKIATIIALFAAVAGTKTANATDIVVDQGGTGSYLTIAAAYAAAVDGDRIFVVPAALPYTETLTLNKSVTIACNSENQCFNLQGTINVNTSGAVKNMTIIGMNLTGSISTNGYGPSGSTRAKLNIFNSKINTGNVVMNYYGYDLYMSGDSVMNGYIHMTTGKLIGNFINNNNAYYYNVYVSNHGTATSDTVEIIGNHFVHNYYNQPCIYWDNSTQFFNISNNYMRMQNTYCTGTYFYQVKNDLVNGRNTLMNNTILFDNACYYGFYIHAYAFGSYTSAFNNLISAPNGGSYGIYCYYSGQTNFLSGYNYVQGNWSNPYLNVVSNGTDTSTATITCTINSSTGQLTAGLGINRGIPDSTFYDLDYTRNDVGCYGGSYTLANFLPSTGNSRVSIVYAPRRVIVGNTLNLKADSYDK